jgi:hypothetical protein
MRTPSSNESERPTDGGPRPPDLRLGTSGYQYDHWKGTFYPADLRKDDWLARYATRFSTVEINATFYGLPTESTVAAWRDAVPDGFLFARAHRIDAAAFARRPLALKLRQGAVRLFGPVL